MASNNVVDASKYIKWDADGVEKVPPNEAEDIQAVANMINEFQKAQMSNHRHVYSGQSPSSDVSRMFIWELTEEQQLMRVLKESSRER